MTFELPAIYSSEGNSGFRALSTESFASECLSGNACLVVSSPTLKVKNRKGHSIAVTEVQCTNSSATLENMVESNGIGAAIENYNIFGGTPFKRSIGLMKQLSEHTAAAYAGALEVLGNETPESIVKGRLSKNRSVDKENNLAGFKYLGITETHSHWASYILFLCYLEQFVEN